MAENEVKNMDFERIKHLLRQDIDTKAATVGESESTFCEDDDHFEMKVKVKRTYSRTTPNKRILRSVENTPVHEESPNATIKRKRKNIEKKCDDENIAKIAERFKKIEEFQLAVE